MGKKVEVLELKSLDIKTAQVTIVGDGDLVLNKMNDVTSRELIDIRKDKAKNVTEKANEWESIITAIHWRDGKPTDFSEEGMKKALKENAPCLTAFGLKKSFGQAVVQNGIDTYSTKFNAGMNIVASGNLIPIKFAKHLIDEKLMSPKRGAPVLVRLNRFTGWSAVFTIQYTGAVYSLEQIVNIINMAGFSIGIGSGRTSGYGRYHVENVEAV
jgi:hypothetical protein